MGKKLRADAVVVVEPFGAQVALFEDIDRMARYHRKVLGVDIEIVPSAYARTHQEVGLDGLIYWSMWLPKTATLSTIVHECSHVVDFMMDAHGVPISLENTEIRAYMLGALFQDVCGALRR